MEENITSHKIRKKRIISDIFINKNYSSFSFTDIINNKKKNNIIINYYSNDNFNYYNSNNKNEINSDKSKSLFNQNFYLLKNNINELIDSNKYILKPKTPIKNSNHRLNQKIDFSYKYYTRNGAKTFKNGNFFFTKNDNSYTKSISSMKVIHKNRSAQNIKCSQSNAFKKNNKNNNNFKQNNNNGNNFFSNYYLKNINLNKYPINNKYINEYNNKLEQNVNINYNKEKLQKNKNTQVEMFENYPKNDKIDNYIFHINQNNIFFKRNNNHIIKKKLLIKKNNYKTENMNIININDLKLISPQRNKVFDGNFNRIHILKNNILNTNNLSTKSKISDLISTNDNKEIIEENKKEHRTIINITKEKCKVRKNPIIDSKNANLNERDIKERVKAYNIITQTGRDKNYRKKINQDYYIISLSINKIKNYNIFGILDGHGLYGHLISIFIGKYILNSFIHNKEFNSCLNCEDLYYKLKYNNFEIINDIFKKAEKELYKAEFDSNFSGTTCIIVIEVGDHIICANCGDSRAILIYSNLESSIENNIDNNHEDEKNNNTINSSYQIKNIIKPFSNYRRCSSFLSDKIKAKKILKKNKKLFNLCTKIFYLSNDLKPNLPLEKKRIEKNGGRIEQSTQKDGSKRGPLRVWVKDEMYPGLAMSRSIGDFIATSIGVIPDPEIIEYTLDKKSRYMVVASDGIWKYISNEEVMKIGNKFYPKHEPIDLCNELVKEANICWEKENILQDDITVLVVYF